METEARQLGEYIVADPRICHGKPTFRGTRILVAVVLEQIADGMPLERIVQGWEGTITLDAIREAVLLARDSLVNKEQLPRRRERSRRERFPRTPRTSSHPAHPHTADWA